MKKFNRKKGQILIGVVTVLLVVTLIGGVLYFHFSKNVEKPKELQEETVPTELVREENTQTVLILVDDALYNGLSEELKTYSGDIMSEFGFESIIKTFPASANVFEIKSYIKQIFNSSNLNGVLIIGNLPSGEFYNPKLSAETVWYQEGLPVNDYIYQDIYDQCVYSKERDAFDWTNSKCEQQTIQPFWISRLTPNSSSKDALALLKDYFKRNHEYRTGKHSYQKNVLVYSPVLLDYDQPTRKRTINMQKDNFDLFNMFEKSEIIDVEKENSGQLFLNEVKKQYGYEILLYNGHGAPNTHQAIIGQNKYVGPDDVVGSSFFYADFRSCSVGRFTTQDYMVGKYLFEGNGLAASAASVPIFASSEPEREVNYMLAVGEPLYQALKVRGRGPANMFGDLTLRMRYDAKPKTYNANDQRIQLSTNFLSFNSAQEETDFRIKNVGGSTLKFQIYPRYHKFKEKWSEGFSFSYSSEDANDENRFYLLLEPNKEATFTVRIKDFFKEAPPGTYKGELFILSNDPLNPFMILPFEAIAK